MYEFLKDLAAANGWPFDYGRSDYHNLFRGAEQKELTHIFLDPVGTTDVDNDSGVVEKVIHSGLFFIVFSSDIDEKSYNDRYQDYIKPILDGDLKLIKNELGCNNNISINLWEKLEVINFLDYNFDGIICTYKITIDE